MGEFGLRWILAALGAVILVAIYLWGMRARLREKLRERRRRAKTLSLEGQPGLERNDLEVPAPDVRDFPGMSPDHHLADKVLVDVEITPVKRSRPKQEETSKVEPAPVTDVRQKPAVTKPPLEPASNTSGKAAPAQTVKQPAPAPEPVSAPEPVPAPKSVEKRESIEQAEEESAAEITGKQEPKVTETPTKTILLTVVAPTGRPYRGPSILLAAQELKLRLHKSGMFDYFPPDQSSRNPLFKVAHLREPGTFDLDTVGNLTTPGLLMYMQLPGPVQAVKALESMLEVADRLTQKLGGTLCNERRVKLTLQNKLQLKGEAADFDRRLQQARQ